MQTMTFETIKTEIVDHAYIITFNRADKRNAISTVVMGEMMAAAAEADRDPNVRGIIITGGLKFFSAGADLMTRRLWKLPPIHSPM